MFVEDWDFQNTLASQIPRKPYLPYSRSCLRTFDHTMFFCTTGDTRASIGPCCRSGRYSHSPVVVVVGHAGCKQKGPRSVKRICAMYFRGSLCFKCAKFQIFLWQDLRDGRLASVHWSRKWRMYRSLYVYPSSLPCNVHTCSCWGEEGVMQVTS